MTQDEIIEMAVKAGIAQAVAEVNIDIMEAFAKLVAEKEREACAELAETPVGEYEVIVACGSDSTPQRIHRYLDSDSIAKAIRARD